MITSIAGISFWMIIKVFVLILLAMYLIFAFVIVKQVQLMTGTLQLGFEAPVKLFSYVHLVYAIFVFLAALIIL